MPTLTAPARRTLADILRDLGGVPPDRVRFDPIPDTATEADLLAIREEFRGCELVCGTLVEKPVGALEDDMGGLIYALIWQYVAARRLGLPAVAPSPFRMAGGNVREPDASFTQRARIPAIRSNPVNDWCPDLCVEVLSPSNTPGEMALKRADYFSSGCRLYWEVDMAARAVAVFTRADAPDAILGLADTLDGGAVIPGFALPLADLWAQYDDLTSNAP